MIQHTSRRRFLKMTAGAAAFATAVGAAASLQIPTVQVASAATQYVSQPTNRVRTLLNAGWQFNLGDVSGAQAPAFNDTSWQQANLPHVFDTPYFKASSWYQGYGWYRRHFTITANQKSARRISLEFEAAFQDAQVYVNGTQVGQHLGGFTGFTFDITSAVNEGDNVVAVRLNNKWNPQLAPRAGEYHFSGGLTRDVYLVITDPVHVTWYGTYVTTPQVSTSQATVRVQTEVQNQSSTTKQVTLTTSIVDATNAVVQTMTASSNIAAGATYTFDQSGTVSNPHLWSPESPYMYTVFSAVQDGSTFVDSYSSPLGIRSIQWSATQGFFLNGNHYFFDGANVHQDIAGWGDGATNADHYRKAQLMKQAGLQAIRESHYPHDVAFDSACDQLGLLVWSELCYWGTSFSTSEQPDWRQSAYPINSQDWTPFEDNLKRMLTEMIRERRNHPSIITWSTGNEVFFTAGFDGSVTDGTGGTVMNRARALTRTLANLAESLDPSRLAGAGGVQRMGFDKYADIAGYNGDGATIAQFQNPGRPSVVTEYYVDGYRTYPVDDDPPAYSWRAGKIIWEGFDYGTWSSNYGSDGLVDYYGRPRQLWYEYRKHYLGTPYTLPSNGTPGRLAISADKTTILGDGTDSAVITVQVQDSSGRDISNNPDVTLTITSGPGAFPTGKTMTFNASNPYHMSNGMARITFRSYLSGSTVITASSSGLPNATLTITTTQLAPDAGSYYALVNAKSGKVLDTNGAAADGTPIIQRADQVGTSQQWQFVAVGNGSYKLVNRQSGLILTVPNASTSTGVQLQLGSDQNSAHQQWQLVDAGRGYFYLTNRNSGLNADVSSASTADGAAVVQWTPNSGTNQQWQFLPVASMSGSGTPTPTPTVGITPTPTSGITPTPTPTSGITPTPTPGTTPTATPTPGSGICSVHYVTNSWPGGFTANLTITNNGTSTINGWTLQFSFPGNQQVTQGWNGVFSQSGNQVTITNASYNGTIPPNGSVNPGFNGSWSGSNPSPNAFTLNGTACSVG